MFGAKLSAIVLKYNVFQKGVVKVFLMALKSFILKANEHYFLHIVDAKVAKFKILVYITNSSATRDGVVYEKNWIIECIQVL